MPGDQPGRARAAGGITLGVEEEFVLLDPASGAASLAAPDLVRMLDGEPGVQQELMRFQVEIATGVCTGLDGIACELARARHGLTGPGVDPLTGQTADARSLLSRLLDHVRPALSDRGDTEHITGLLQRLDGQGTGADRQRALFAAALSAPAFVEALARATLPGDEPSYSRQPDAGSGRRAASRSAAGRWPAAWGTAPQCGSTPAGR